MTYAVQLAIVFRQSPHPMGELGRLHNFLCISASLHRSSHPNTQAPGLSYLQCLQNSTVRLGLSHSALDIIGSSCRDKYTHLRRQID